MLGNYQISGIPLYVIVITSLLIGIFISWLISLADSLSSIISMHGKISQLQKAKEEIIHLKEDNHELELENAQLKGEQKHIVEENYHGKEEDQDNKHSTGGHSFVESIQHVFGRPIIG